jgi:5,6-dimethylbenzimidazole synthase
MKRLSTCLGFFLIGVLVNSALAQTQYTPEQEYLFNIIKTRRTVRKYKSTAVPKEHILKILDAARMAATAGNQQPWKFLVIQDKEKLTRLKEELLNWNFEAYKEKIKPEELEKAREASRKYYDGTLSAPVYVVVLVDTKAKYPDFILYDGTLAAGNLMLAARALGYGTGFFTFLPQDKAKAFFKIPEQYKLICFVPIGVPEEWPPTPAKKSLEEVVVFESF